ncbi:hypothetical protein B0T14DRAFT_525986 [Immersiella caudata]|uniref:Uncharacterized protein n=1 Tax=Immersiella caudata TaxID=314043 RepID=A0AA39WDB5_9PEZI|nr:hypothetical protein B0T14DRAFT_525986 [Immersiella caudata]
MRECSTLIQSANSKDKIQLTCESRKKEKGIKPPKYHFSFISKSASWRNGSAFDSRSKGYPFKSGRGQFIYFCIFLCPDSVAFLDSSPLLRGCGVNTHVTA